jgi:hypothetical protein
MALIISFGLVNQDRGSSEQNNANAGDILAAFSTESARRRILQSRTDLIPNGVLEGLPAALLAEGSWNNFDVIAMLIRASISPKDIAERTIQAVDVIIPEVKFESDSVRHAEKLELGLSDGSNGV